MKHSIYTSTMRGVPVWLVCSGDAPGFGDTIWKTEEEAIAYAGNAKRREAEREASAKRERQECQRREAARKEREDLDGFGDGLPPMAKGKLLATLTRTFLFRGIPASRRDIVRTLVREGRKIETLDGERVLIADDGAFLGEKTLTKAGIDYASFLLNRNR